MASQNDSSSNLQNRNSEERIEPKERPKDLSILPPSGTSLHKRRRGEPPATLSVKSPQTPSEEGSSPCTATISEQWVLLENDCPDPKEICESMLQHLKDKDDHLSKRGRDVATKTKGTLEAIDELEKLLDLLNQLVTLKQRNDRVIRKLKDVNHLKKLHSARKKIEQENDRIKSEIKELELINEVLDNDFDTEYGQALFDSIISGSRMKRSGSKWKGHARFGGSLLRKPRSRSAGGDDSDAGPGSPLRRRSDGIFMKDVEKSKVSKWTRVKAAFRWEKAQWPPNTIAGAAGAVAAGAMVGAVALAGSNPPSTPGPLTTSASATLANPERDSASLTPGSALSLTPNSSCEELRMDSGPHRKSIHEDNYLHAPTQDDSSTSPSPNKLHKSPWIKMRDIIQTRRDSVKKKSSRGSKSSPDVVPARRRSLSDGGDSDAPPALTLTIPSSEELESEPHPVLRKQRSLELGARPPQHRPPRASKWTKVKRAFLTSASVSVPSSPNRHSAFFTDADTEGVSSGCEVREEIARDYAALQLRLRREFSDRRGKLYAASRPVATEEQLSADFRKKLAEWQRMKGGKQPPPVPARKDLSEDFLKKWDDWKKMKETNSVPAWEGEAKPDEVLVQTSTGLFKFKGISRSFTRKLHEWEKSRGIAPEVSTSALIRAAKARTKVPTTPLTRTQSDGSVAPSASGSGRLHASSLSVNDVDDFDSEFEREQSVDADECDGSNTRGAVLVEVEAEEVCTAAPLMAVSPRHQPQKPVYTYGQAEARLLCETSSAITGRAVLQSNGSRCHKIKEITTKSLRTESKKTETSTRKQIIRQPSIEEDALFIRKTIEEIERGCSSHLREMDALDSEKEKPVRSKEDQKPSTSKTQVETSKSKESLIRKDSIEEVKDDKRNNGKKKSKSRARLEREQSKPSESDTELDVDTVTVEIPRRKKRPRRASERPRTPPASLHSDSEGEIFVLKLRASEMRDGSPEVIVKTTRKIFSPVVRSGESVPRAVIPVDVEDLKEVRPTKSQSTHQVSDNRKKIAGRADRKKEYTRSKSSGDLQNGEEQKPRSRPPLPLSPSSQRKPQSKETAPSIRIMIQRYNMKINEEGHTSGPSSGASSPAWRSPIAARRPLDMPVGVNIRNNPFLEREVQKSASACQLSRRDQTSAEKLLTPTSSINLDRVLKSHSANALHSEQKQNIEVNRKERTNQESQETLKITTESTDTIVPNQQILSENQRIPQTEAVYIPILRQFSDTVVPSSSRYPDQISFERSLSSGEAHSSSTDAAAAAKLSERAAKIKAAREKFLASPSPIRREGTSSTSDLRPGDRSSRISCDSDVTESQSSGAQESNLGRSASTGMVNVDRESWQRVADNPSRRKSRQRPRFSFARLAAKLRRKDDGAVSTLCRQSLLVQIKK